jgi:hypothetical protein
MSDLKQNTLIYYDINGTLKGYGKIVGQSTISQVFIGAGYIIEPENSITNAAYPYSHFVLFENQFRVVPIAEVRKRKLKLINKK